MCGIAALFKRHDQITSDDIGAVGGLFAPARVGDLIGLDDTDTRESLHQFYQSLGPGRANGEPSAAAFNHLELKRYLHDQLLRDADAFNMAHALELRVPYLDHTLVEYAVAISPLFKLDHGVSNPLLVHAMGKPASWGLAGEENRAFRCRLTNG
jgi:hypothetical protein